MIQKIIPFVVASAIGVAVGLLICKFLGEIIALIVFTGVIT